MFIKFNKHTIIIAVALIFILGCATYYQKSMKFQTYLLDGDIENANTCLEKDTKAEKGKNRLLYYLNRGVVSWMLSKNQESINFFVEADRMIEDQQKNYGQEVLALITNPNAKAYTPEDFEKVMLNYYQALNYLQLNQYNEALVECRRINIKLNELNDKYKDHKNRYQQDAFANNLMGIIYEANKDYNNAFIAYRNALEVYEKDYVTNFNVGVPEQLKKDLLRTAYKTGFYEDVRFYENKFNMKYENKPSQGGELIFFWQNGFGPVKSEWSINFTNLGGDNGWVTLVNDEYGLNFPFYIGDKSDNEKQGFADLKMLRIAFPKYTERKPYYNNAVIQANNSSYNLETAQNINAIAFKTLQDRMLREIANSVLRLATKKALELAARKENQNLGAAVSIVNAITEKADTRNWQTLPYSISYTRIPLPEGENKINLVVSSNSNQREYPFTFNISKNKTTFFAFQNIESIPFE